MALERFVSESEAEARLAPVSTAPRRAQLETVAWLRSASAIDPPWTVSRSSEVCARVARSSEQPRRVRPLQFVSASKRARSRWTRLKTESQSVAPRHIEPGSWQSMTSVSVRSAWSKMAPSPARSPATAAARMSAREKSVAVTVAPVRSASSKSALLKDARERTAPEKSAPKRRAHCSDAPERSAPRKSANERSAKSSSALRRLACAPQPRTLAAHNSSAGLSVDGELGAARRLRDAWLDALIWVASRLHLGYISAVSRLCLAVRRLACLRFWPLRLAEGRSVQPRSKKSTC
mmetsp:Transcript_39536/g.127939  ORF Transcript_39536/g.127939 Transcript_39536/m.127939 type:complete len:292 (+) Transcript_39536:304-1179(+)